MGGAPETTENNVVSIPSKHINAILIAIIGGVFSLGVAYLANKPDTADRYYGHQGVAHERRTVIIEEWIRQHTIFGWENLNATNERFARLEADTKHATEVTRECMEKVK